MIQINRNLKLVDSNILIDFFLKTKVEEQLDLVFRKPIYLNLTIFTEVINFIQNKVSFKDSFESASIIIDHPNRFLFLPVTPEDLILAKKINQKYFISKVGFSDSLILAQAQNFGLELLSQDLRLQIYPEVGTTNPFYE